MKPAKYYKDFFNQLPDNMPVALVDWECDIESFRFSTDIGVIELKLTPGFSVVRDEFMDMMFNNKRTNEK